MPQKRIMSVTVEGRHKQPKGHKLTGPTAWAVKGLRVKEALWLAAEPFASDKMEQTVPTKTKHFQEKTERISNGTAKA